MAFDNFHGEVNDGRDNHLSGQRPSNLGQSNYGSGDWYGDNGMTPPQAYYSHPAPGYQASPCLYSSGPRGTVGSSSTPQGHPQEADNAPSYHQSGHEYGSSLSMSAGPPRMVATATHLDNSQHQGIDPPTTVPLGSTNSSGHAGDTTASTNVYKQYDDLTTPAACREWIATHQTKAGSKKLENDTGDWKEVLEQSQHHIGQIFSALSQKYDDTPMYRENVSAKALAFYHTNQAKALDKLRESLKHEDIQKLATAYATILFHAAVDLHRCGLKDELFDQLQGRVDGKPKSKADGSKTHEFSRVAVDPLSCRDRFAAIVKSIQSHKMIAQGLLEGNNLYELAANPKAVLLSKARYDSSNRQRQDKIEQSRELIRAAREASEEAEGAGIPRTTASASSMIGQSRDPPPARKRKRVSERHPSASLAPAAALATPEPNNQQVVGSRMQSAAVITMGPASVGDQNPVVAAGSTASPRGNHAEFFGDPSVFAADPYSRTMHGTGYPPLQHTAADPYDFQVPGAQPSGQPYFDNSAHALRNAASTPYGMNSTNVVADYVDPSLLFPGGSVDNSYSNSFGQDFSNATSVSEGNSTH